MTRNWNILMGPSSTGPKWRLLLFRSPGEPLSFSSSSVPPSLYLYDQKIYLYRSTTNPSWRRYFPLPTYTHGNPYDHPLSALTAIFYLPLPGTLPRNPKKSPVTLKHMKLRKLFFRESQIYWLKSFRLSPHFFVDFPTVSTEIQGRQGAKGELFIMLNKSDVTKFKQ